MSVIKDRRVVLGVTGGIAAYKAAALASLLVQAGAHVDVVMTDSARRFVQPLTFSAITHTPVHDDLFAAWTPETSGHVALAARADVLLVAPATAASIARLALGLSDDLLGLVALSTAAPLLVAPAMEDHMFHHPATQAHLATLVSRGATIVGPEQGRLASGATGDGRMADPETIVGALRRVLGSRGPLAGKQIVVTAGGTREALDPVRYLGNRSSGKMGFALAQVALDLGADVTLITGPTALTTPVGATVVRVESASEMQAAVKSAIASADALVMAAAVADYRPETVSTQKIKKGSSSSTVPLRLVRTDDILANIDTPGLVKVGFAAETDDLLANADLKLTEKRLSMIVANEAKATIGAADSEATLLFPDREPLPLPRMPKTELAETIMLQVVSLLADVESTPR
jgi:phosphopantothenoylcysteine decarboxylase/phosphopantothenate--cysteine ligase